MGSLSVTGLGRYERDFVKSQGADEGAQEGVTNKYADRFENDTDETQEMRNDATKKGADKGLVQDYYSMATDLYEFGWGESFHFGILWKDSSLEDAIRRYEYYLPQRMQVKPGDKLLDLGCGIGGPMRNIARFSGAHVTGINISPYQVYRANMLNKSNNVENLCEAVVGDFTALKNPDNSVDGVYAIEATCHTTDKDSVYSEAFRVLKPGAYFAAWEWVVTDKYDPKNEEHKSIRFGVEKGNGLPETVHWSVCVDSLKNVGFEVVDHFDGCERGEVPWYSPLAMGSMDSLSGVARTKIGQVVTGPLIYFFESLGLVPKGVYDAQQLLKGGAENLVRGGQTGIYSVSYFLLARKPLK